jgi:cbb3-type cytochrome oxidase maturation protein
MNALLYLIPAALFLGLLGLGAFLWSLRSGQYDDLDGAAERILYDDDEGAQR